MLAFLKSIDWNKWIPLATGIAISVVSASYSIAGLVAIFSSAALSIVIMGSVLEAGKVVTASHLYRNWNSMSLLFKGYFTTAVVVLMLITSMGTFGYLSKAHIQGGFSASGAQIRVERIDEQIAREQRRSERTQTRLDQLDAAVDAMIAEGYASRALSFRDSQNEERAVLEAALREAENNIDGLVEIKEPLIQEIRTNQNEVGPIRYVAELIYGESDPSLMEKAVRYMILLLVFVFDPLAVLLIMISTNNKGKARKTASQNKKRPTRNKVNVAATKDGIDWEEKEVDEPEKRSTSVLNAFKKTFTKS